MHNNKHGLNTSFLDVIFILVFVLLLIVIRSKQTKAEEETTLERKSPYICTLEWDDKSSSDLDIWCEDPNGEICSYKNRQNGFMNLDKDDTGLLSDTVSEDVLYLNREELNFSKVIDGWYTINIHVFNLRDNSVSPRIELISTKPYKSLKVKGLEKCSENGTEIIGFRFLVQDEKVIEFSEEENYFVVNGGAQ